MPARPPAHRFTPKYQHVAKMQNVSGSVNAACVASLPAEDSWKCFMAQYTLPHITTPYFIVNSFYDAWQWSEILGMPCHCTPTSPKGCGCAAPALRAAEALRADMIGNVSRTLTPAGVKNSAFLYSCLTHCGQFAHDDRWAALTVGGKSLRDAFGDWVKFAEAPPRVDCDGLRCNPSCGGTYPRYTREGQPIGG